MSFKGVIFDMDGTLLDTLGDLANSMNSVLEQFGYPTHPVEAYRYFVGEGMEMLVRRALPSAALEIAGGMGLKPEEIAFLGDSGIDMQTATRAGMYPVGALWGFRTKEELRLNGARALAACPRELVSIIAGE